MNYKEIILLVIVGVVQGQNELQAPNVYSRGKYINEPLTVTLNFEDTPNNVNINFIRSPKNRQEAEQLRYETDNAPEKQSSEVSDQTKAEQSFLNMGEQFIKQIQTELAAQKDELISAIEKNISPTESSNQNAFDEHLNWLSEKTYADCAEALNENQQISGVYILNSVTTGLKPFGVYCESGEGEAWTIIQRRKDGSENFDRNWADYKNGFGNLQGEYWLGLERIHKLTSSAKHELWFQMETYTGDVRSFRYDEFSIGDESQSYELELSGFHGKIATLNINYNNRQKFTTKDHDMDGAYYNCAQNRKGAFWHDNCSYCNPNGEYKQGNDATGIYCGHWHEPMKYFHIAIRQVTSTADIEVKETTTENTEDKETTTETLNTSDEIVDEETTTETLNTSDEIVDEETTTETLNTSDEIEDIETTTENLPTSDEIGHEIISTDILNISDEIERKKETTTEISHTSGETVNEEIRTEHFDIPDDIQFKEATTEYFHTAHDTGDEETRLQLLHTTDDEEITPQFLHTTEGILSEYDNAEDNYDDLFPSYSEETFDD